MATESQYFYLAFNINVLRTLRLWPNKGEAATSWASKISRHLFIVSMLPSTLPLVYDIVQIPLEEDGDLVQSVQVLLAFIVVLGTHYMSICFVGNQIKVQKLIDAIDSFKKFCESLDLVEIDKRSLFFSKGFMAYSVMGILTYATVPLITRKQCEVTKNSNMKRHGIPCGLVARVRWPFKFDYSPLFEIVYLHQLYIVTASTFLIISITMLLCGLLLQTIEQFKNLRKMILKISTCSEEQMKEYIKFCIEYHNAIIGYSENINEAFSSQMLMHITLTSFVISVLGFEILMVNNLTDSIRFTLHLLGWFVLLFLVCFYGQKLIDESTGVAHDAYSTLWFNCPISVQKDVKMIMIRAQKPLTLNAINLGVMSLATFLRILSSAYSYFTLLVNLRS